MGAIFTEHVGCKNKRKGRHLLQKHGGESTVVTCHNLMEVLVMCFVFFCLCLFCGKVKGYDLVTPMCLNIFLNKEWGVVKVLVMCWDRYRWNSTSPISFF